MKLILWTVYFVIVGIPTHDANAQYGPGPYINPQSGQRYYVPREYPRTTDPYRGFPGYAPRWRYAPQYGLPEVHGYPRPYPGFVDCRAQPWRCPGPP